ncbi:unnamed protein product [Rhizoctonia solani]|uniref:Uncharacterized protein n=1 Tax=Rhizoctonia solani TaxID=456999 RepID=A0A8H3ALD8_9AGAM|nr:unnamed protein product [Rhizoctonia solani]
MFKFASSDNPLNIPQNATTSHPKTKLEFAEGGHGLWHSIFNWAFLMLIVTPKPDVRQINKHQQYQYQSSASSNTGILSRLSQLFFTRWRLFSATVKGAFSTLRSPFASKSSKSQPPVLPYYIPPLPRADTSLEPTIASLATLGASSADDTIRTPARAVMPNHDISKPDIPASPDTSPTTARFLATLTDLEARMNNHQFYDLERELADMDSHMAQLFNFSWMPSKTAPTLEPNPSEIPITMILPQAPPPARRDGKTIQILPMICEVSENSPDLANTPPYDPRRWSIITFQPLWGPRTQVGAAY